MRLIVLVKHAQPVLEAAVPPRLWQLSVEGEAQARRLAERLAEFMPLTLVCSKEPKAKRTCEMLSDELRVPLRVIGGLEEIDRPVLPISSPDEYQRLNARLFQDLSTPAIGRESGAQALSRLSAALTTAIEASPGTDTLVVVTHGTVIALLVAKHNEMDAMDLWKRLTCPSFVVLALPGFELRRVVDHWPVTS